MNGAGACTSPAGGGGDDGGQRATLSRLIECALPVLQKAAPAMMGAGLRARCRTSDLVQSALVEAVASMGSFRGQGDSEFVAWTLRIMEHNVIDRRRRLQAQKRSADREHDEGEITLQHLVAAGAAPPDQADDREQLLNIVEAMMTLTVDQQRVLQLVALRGASHAEAARRLQKTEPACRALLARARSALLTEMARRRERRGG